MSGSPSSLLNDRSLAAVAKAGARQWYSRSLVVVFPTEPVIPTTRPLMRCRAATPRSISARPVSSTTIAVAPTDSRSVK